MPDQTPEVCACGHDRWSHGNDLLCAGCPPHERHPFRPAEPTPAEQPEGEWRRVGEVGHGEVHWRIDSRDIDAVVSLSLERAISSAAVAEAAATRWATAQREYLDMKARAEAAERALEEAREALRALFSDEGCDCDWAYLAKRAGGEVWPAYEHASDCPVYVRFQPYEARLRALVSTESREEGGER